MRHKRIRKPITAYLTADERLALAEATNQSGKSISRFLIEAGLIEAGKQIKAHSSIPAINQEQWGKLATMSSNLNQIAFKLNTGQKAELQAVLEATELLRQVRNLLLNSPDMEND